MAAGGSFKVTIISAKGLNKVNLVRKMGVYAVVHISGTVNQDQKQRTLVDKDGDSNPTWNQLMNFTIDESAALQNRLTLVVNIKTEGMFGDKDVGEVNIPIKELLEGYCSTRRKLSYQVLKPSGKPKGKLKFSFKFRAGVCKSVPAAYPTGIPDPVTTYRSTSLYPKVDDAPAESYPPPPPPPPPAYVAGFYPPAGSAYYLSTPDGYQPQSGYGCYPPPPPPPGYGGYPPPPPPPPPPPLSVYAEYDPLPWYGYPLIQQPDQKNKLGIGGWLLGALLFIVLGGFVQRDCVERC